MKIFKLNTARFLRNAVSALLILCSLKGFSGKEKVTNRLAGASFTTSATLLCDDNKSPYIQPSAGPGNNYTVTTSTAKITFGINEQSSEYIFGNYNASVTLMIRAYDKNGALISSVSGATLNINYDAAAPYTDRSVFVVNDAHRIVAVVQDIKINGTSVTDPNDMLDLYLDAEVETDRYYDFDPTLASGSGYYSTVGSTVLSASNELLVHWEPMRGAETYELEWTYVNDYDGIGGAIATSSVAYSFRDNATRVRVTDNFYKISMIYEHGYILYRVRGIGRRPSFPDFEAAGNWSADPTNPVGNMLSTYIATYGSQYYNVTSLAHEENKNWQYSSTYAEDGKKKEVVSYFDGTLRNRQTVTRINSDNNVLVGETIYDHQGRPAVEVLPVPTKTNSPVIKYYEDFNLSATYTFTGSVPQPFSCKDFDLDTVTACPPGSYGMFTAVSSNSYVNGASYYYSPNNPDNQGPQSFIPDAQTYPFTQKVYTPDNTGRVRAQGGVGPAHQIGSGHETTYLYTQPDQAELDRLFGSEAGYNYRYKKNVTVDPNGQISIAYVNEEGKTVATALAGNAPTSLNALASNSTSPINSRYFKYTDPDYVNKNVESGNSMVFSKPIVPTATGTYSFDYNVIVPVYSNTCTPNLCYSCVYDLDIFIIDQCGDTIFKTSPITVQIGAQTSSVATTGTTCPSSYTFSPTSSPTLSNFTVTLAAGKSYMLSKALSIDENALNDYAKSYTDTLNNSCIQKISSLAATQYSNVDPNDCNQTCASCISNVVTYHNAHMDSTRINDTTYIFLSQTDYHAMLDKCSEGCTPTSICGETYQMMLGDVSPTGQYALYNINSNNAYDATGIALSVLNTNGWPGNSLPFSEINNNSCATKTNYPNLIQGGANWRYPNFYNTDLHAFVKPAANTNSALTTASLQVPYYFDDDGSESKIYIVPDPDTLGTFIPKIRAGATTYTNTSGVYIYPQDLKYLKDFVDHFNSYWSRSLVVYHPEFSYFLECDKWSNPTYTNAVSTGSITGNYTSDQFDDIIRSAISYTDAVTKFPSLSSGSYADVVNNDPFIQKNRDQVNYTFVSHLSLDYVVTSFTNALANYSGSGKSITQVAADIVSCGNRFYDCACTCTFGAASTNTNLTTAQKNDKEWQNFSSMYLATKYKYQSEHMHDVNKFLRNESAGNLITTINNARPPYDITAYNGPIGAAHYNFLTDNFYWRYHTFIFPNLYNSFDKSGFFSDCQAINHQTFGLYSAKIKRFANDQDALTSLTSGSSNINDQINDLSAKAQSELFYSTGQCPLTFQLQTFLDYLTQNQLFSNPPTDLQFIDGFTKDLYDQVYTCENGAAPNPTVCSYSAYKLYPSISSGTVTLDIKNVTSSVVASMTISPQSAINWSQAKNITNLAYMGGGMFTAIAHVDSYTNTLQAYEQVNLQIQSTCFTPSCNIPTQQCNPSQAANDLLSVLNTLLAVKEGSLTTSPSYFEHTGSNVDVMSVLTSTPASLPASTFFSNLFLKPFGTGITTLNYQLSGTSTSAFTNTAGVGFTLFYTPLTNPSPINFSNIDHFTSIQPDPILSTQFMMVAALKTPTNTPSTSSQTILVNIIYSGVSSADQYVLGTCSDPLPPGCNNPTAKATLDMQNFVAEVISTANSYTSIPSPIDLSSFNYYTADIQSEMPSIGTYSMNNFSYYNSNLTFSFTVGNPTVTTCGFTVTLPATSTNNITQVKTVDKVSATQNNGEMTLFVTMNNGSTDVLTLESPCMKFMNCERCDQTTYTPLFVETFSAYTATNLPVYNPSVTTQYDMSIPSTFSISIFSTPTVAVCHVGGAGTSTLMTSDGQFYGAFLYPFASPNPTTSPVLWTTTLSVGVPQGTYYFSLDYTNCGDCNSFSSRLGRYDVYINGNYNTSFVLANINLSLTTQWRTIKVPLAMASYSTLTQVDIRFNKYNGCTMPYVFFDNIKIFRQDCPRDTVPIYPPQTASTDCEDQQLEYALNTAYKRYGDIIDSTDQAFRQDYLNRCKQSLEELNVAYTSQEHHYTLYYYDQAGNLIKTIPPEGVEMINLSATVPFSSNTYAVEIENDRENKTHNVLTSHRMPTRYEYNSLNQLIHQDMPDHSTADVWRMTAQNGLPSGYTGNSIAFDPALPLSAYNVGVDGSGNGVLYKSSDEGSTWSEVSSISYGNITALSFSTTSIGFAVTDQGNMLTTTNGGTSWSPVSSFTNTTPMRSVYATTTAINGVSYLVAVGDNGAAYISTNSGTSFSTLNTGVTNNLNRIRFAFDQSCAVIVGDNGTLLYTDFTTGATSFTIAAIPVSTNINLTDGYTEMEVVSSNSVMAAMVCGYDNTSANYKRGKILFADNLTSKSVVSPPIPVVSTIYSDASVNTPINTIMYATNASTTVTKHGYSGGNAGRFSVSTFTGTFRSNAPSAGWYQYSGNWLTPSNKPDIHQFVLDYAYAPKGLFGALSNGNLFAFTPNQANEFANTSSISGNNAIAMISTSATAVMAGNNSAITKVGTLLNTYTPASPTFTPENQFSLPPLNGVAARNNTVFAVGNSGAVVYSTGGTFTSTTVGSNSYHDVAINTNGDVLMVGRNVVETYTAGSFANISLSGTYNGVEALSTGAFVLLNSSGGIERCSAGTLSGVGTSSSTTNAALFALDDNNLFVVGSGGDFGKSTDGGLTWSISNTGAGQNLRAVYFKDAATGYVFGENDAVLKTIDGGATWLPESGVSGTYTTNAAAMSSQGNLLLTGGGASNLQNLSDQANDYSTRFYYDELGRLVISQNAKQYPNKAYSYTIYDALGRITQVGETNNGTDPETLTNSNGVIATSSYNLWLSGGSKSQVTSTFYDTPAATAPVTFTQDNTRKRVTATIIDDDDNLSNGYTHAMYYDYDAHGNVSTLMNDYPEMATYGLQYTTVQYDYDLVSGKVNAVRYQKDQPDQMLHKYEYDADNRITNVMTSRDNITWDQDAKYFYYKHGPLARTELGDGKAQGIDYAYTIQGWIKAVNSANLDAATDIGKDADGGSNYDPAQAALHGNVAKDAFGYNLHYFNNDYAATNSTLTSSYNPLASVSTNTFMASSGSNLYNGNIRGMVTTLTDMDPLSGTYLQPAGLLYTYKYDQLNRINAALAYNDYTVAANAYGTGGAATANLYKNELTYDANGNIATQTRYDQNGSQFDDMTYQYHDYSGKRYSNRLYHVNDAIGSGAMSDDIDDEGTFTAASSSVSTNVINSSNNYKYDAIGNLIADKSQNIQDIDWTVYGKISHMHSQTTGMFSALLYDMDFEYDAAGNRILKSWTDGLNVNKTYYIRDAQGNVMANYKYHSQPFASPTFVPQEWNMYGSSRLGEIKNDVPLASMSFSPTAPSYTTSHTRAGRVYELSNHLGNVLSVVSDRKVPIAAGTNTNCVNVYDFNSGIPGNVLPQNLTLTNPNQEMLCTFQNVGFSGMDIKMGTLTVGATYVVEFDFDPGTIDLSDGLYILPYDVDHSTFTFYFGSYFCNGSFIPPNGHLSFTYTPSASGPTIDSYLAMNSAGASTHHFTLDNISICPVGQIPQPIASYTPEILSTQDYYPFGDFLRGRGVNPGTASRYTFNGKEIDGEEVSTSGANQDYGMRIYNPSLGKFLSVDPLTKNFSSLTPYQYASNSPIASIDLDGLEASFYMLQWDKESNAFELVNYKTVDSRFQTILGNTINNNKANISFVYGTDGHWHQVPKEWENRSLNEAGDAKTVFELVNSWENSDLAYEVASTLESLETIGTTAAAAVTLADALKNLKGLLKGNKKVDYSDIDPKKGVTEGADFTKAQKKAILAKNKAANNGVLKDDVTGKTLNPPKKDVKGVKTDMNSAQVDHVVPKSKGGSNAGSNAQVISKEANTKKGNKIE